MHMYVQIQALVLVLNTYMHRHINMFTYANTYVCTYSSTCIYIHTHTHIPLEKSAVTHTNRCEEALPEWGEEFAGKVRRGGSWLLCSWGLSRKR